MLREYIERRNVDRREFAATLGISRGFLSLLESGKRSPGLDLAVRIERMTAGAVPASSWVAETSGPGIGDAA